MKRLAFVISIAAVLALVVAAVASATITGKYRTTISKPASVSGTWTVNFKSNGSVVITHNGQVKEGKLKGSALTVPGGKSCPTVGTYKVKLTGTKLTFSVIKDSCKVGRKLVFIGHTFTKVS